ncbi:MAG: cyclic lactone autoinducer peptide [Lachnospiraceae bacterium]|nr:cyclic lactone autoinducer peptide [Lachnospiraceae bacterium]
MEVKKNNKLSKWIVSGAGKVLTLVAVVFASTPCYGHLYEPEIPQQLKKKDK